MSMIKYIGNALSFVGKAGRIFSKPDLKQSVNKTFALRNRFFSRKKKPTPDSYPYDLVDPYLVFGENMAKCAFSLVGRNWLDRESQKPVAMLWGFNHWKWGFASDYLAEYRVAFAPRKILPLRAILTFRKFPIRPHAFIFWGYTEPAWINFIAKVCRIKVYRMEDGFLRSSMLGAAHTTPYSLTLDSNGLHYDARKPSDLERLLNQATFTDRELRAASECLDMLHNLELSKYNPPHALNSESLGIKTKRRVAVLGQVDNDMSVRLGNPQRWSMIELIKLAKLEHPEAEILYRPHPEVYLGYQRSRFQSRRIDSVCTVVSPKGSLVDFLGTVDHVYTITSLAGLEALLNGIPVTVVGTPFYAGWGLTDDRVVLNQRKAKLTLAELFAGAYLRYPRYLADVDNSVTGFKAAALRIAADRHINGCLAAKYESGKDGSVRNIARSAYWPQLLFTRPGPVAAEVESAIMSMDVGRFLNNAPGKLFQYTLLLAICGKITDHNIRDSFLSKIRHYIDPDIYNDVILLLHKYSTGSYVYKQLSWLLSECDEFDSAEHVLHEALKLERKRIEEASEDSGEDADEAEGQSKVPEEPRSLSPEQQRIFRNLYDIYYAERKIDLAVQVAGVLMASGCADHAMLLSMARVAELRFDLRSAYGLADFCQHIDVHAMKSASSVVRTKALEIDVVDEKALSTYLSAMALYITLKPDQVESAFLLLKKQEHLFDLDEIEEILLRTLYLDNFLSTEKAMAFKSIGDNERAIRIMESVISAGNNSDSALLFYSQCLSFAGEVDRALSIVLHAIKKHDSKILFGEAIRLLLIDGHFARADALIKKAELKKIIVSDMLRTKTFFGCRRVRDALRVYAEIPFKKIFHTYYKDLYFDVDKPEVYKDSVLALAIYGPGDEIRFASMYHKIKAALPHRQVTVSCDPRLLNMLSRSFPDLDFVPVARRRFHEIVNKDDYDMVPGSDLIGALDNNGVKAISNADQVMLVTDLLHVCLPDYDQFEGKPYLYAEPALVEDFRKRLPKGRPLVGLSWRSSLTTHSRNAHYLAIEELEKIFKIDGIQFVNFQYDECSKELAWVEERYPGKLLHFDMIDHYNDFDSVAALMKCMDLMIAPATTVVELSGALGCPTWLLSNSAELHWRKIGSDGGDVWHHQTKHVEGAVLGDKLTLVDQLYVELLAFSQVGRGADVALKRQATTGQGINA